MTPYGPTTLPPMPLQSLESIRAAIGEPAYERPNVALYRGDCRQLLDAAPKEAFSLIVTSPPYNIGKEYEADRKVEDYVGWCSEWLDRLPRVMTPTGAFWLNLGYLKVPEQGRAVPIPYLLWDRVPMFLIQEVVWHYGAGVAARHSYSPRNEKFLWYVRDPESYYFDLDSVRDPNVKYPNQFKNGRRKVNPLGKNPTDVWSFPKVTSGRNRSSKERTPHPAQFPTAVIERIIKASCPPGGVILDPFMGSGTVAEVALRLERAVVGFEIEPRYLDISAARLDAVADELRFQTAQLVADH